MARYQQSEREARYNRARADGLPPVVSEGDSWFSYELYLNMMDRIDDTARYAIKRLESSGDTLVDMIGDTPKATILRSFERVVKDVRPLLVFFSGGGNDIVGDEFAGALQPFTAGKPAKWYLTSTQWKEMITGVTDRYERLITTIGPIAPIFAHGYDYIIPSQKPVKIYKGISSGPWVIDEMEAKGITSTELQQKIAAAMIDQFNDILKGFEKKYAGFFAHIDLRESIDVGGWQNEIHPKKEGFQKLAKSFLKQVDAKLPELRKSRANRLDKVVA